MTATLKTLDATADRLMPELGQRARAGARALAQAPTAQKDAALAAIARGLACDRAGVFRARLLEKQQQILALVSAKHTGEQEWLARRAARLLKT